MDRLEKTTDLPQDEPLLTAMDVAKWLSVSRSKVYLMMEQEKLPYVQIGGSRRVYRKDVLALLKRGRIGGRDDE